VRATGRGLSTRRNTDASRIPISTDLTGVIPAHRRPPLGTGEQHGWYACANPDLPMFGALFGIVHVDGKRQAARH